ncbi:uncharacterized protein LOC132034770 [Lycium ferocissimum]|uniref:uncharacterized protein LOC132034770 n=1 Tax=Lycium ferocissimum TaxID=112874 RepID=UPI002815E394|nr:uncharacterized protein LOC132034770 [Lycium ferocissimum]
MGALPTDCTWSFQDDLLLLNTVKAGDSLELLVESLANGTVQFSRIFTVPEMQDRWQTLKHEFEHSAWTTQSKCNTLKRAKESKKCVPKKRKAERSIQSSYDNMCKRISNDSFDSVNVNVLGGAGEDCMFVDPVIDNFCNTQSDFHVMPNDILEYGDDDCITASSTFPIGQNYNGDVSLESFSIQDFAYGIEETLLPTENHETIATFGGSFQPNELPAMAGQFDGDMTNASSVYESQFFSGTVSSSSFDNFGYSAMPPQLPDWGIIPDASVPSLPDFEYGVNNDGELVFTGLDGNEMIDASSFDDFMSSLLLDTPDETDKGVSGISKAQDVQMLSSALAVDLAFPEMPGGVINCTLNTEVQEVPNNEINCTLNTEVQEVPTNEINCTLNTEVKEVPNNDDVFLPIRTLSTSSALEAHKQYLKTQHRLSSVNGFSNKQKASDERNSGMMYQLQERSKRTINKIEWAPDACTQIAIAVLRGRHLKYLIKKTRVNLSTVTQLRDKGSPVFLGRAGEHVKVDIDLSEEGPDNRRQAIIKMDLHGVFYFLNIGKNPGHVNGFELLPNQSLTITSGSLITV